MVRSILAKTLPILLLSTGVALASQDFQLRYAPVSSWFPQTPRYERASSLASGGGTFTSEQLEQVGKNYTLRLRTASEATPAVLAKTFQQKVRACEQLARGTAGYASRSFTSGGLQGVEIRYTTAAGEHLEKRFMMVGNQLVEASASWSGEEAEPTVEHFMHSVQSAELVSR